MTALQSMAPDIMEAIKYLNKIAQDVNAMGINSCEAAKGLMAASGVRSDGGQQGQHRTGRAATGLWRRLVPGAHQTVRGQRPGGRQGRTP